jgi:hypothetical protein
MVDRRRLVGNEIRAGGKRRPPQRAAFPNAQELQARRARLIAIAAKPPPLPLPEPLNKTVPDTAFFNQLAYSVLLIAILAVVSIATNFINWAFLAYGIAAVILRLPSRIIVISALVCLVIIPVTTALSRNSLADTFSVMTFYFLLIGLIRAGLELRREDL